MANNLVLYRQCINSECNTLLPITFKFCPQCAHCQNPVQPLAPTSIPIPPAGDDEQPASELLGHPQNYAARNLQLTLKDRNCGCSRVRQAKSAILCNFPTSLWFAVHFWSILYGVCIESFVIWFIIYGDLYMMRDLFDIVFCSVLILWGVVPPTAQIYAVHHCNTCLMYVMRVVVWFQICGCLIAFFSLLIQLFTTYQGFFTKWDILRDYLLAYGLLMIGYIALVWMDNVFLSVQVLARFFKDGGAFPTANHIKDLQQYACCFVDPCALVVCPLCLPCCVCIAVTGQGAEAEEFGLRMCLASLFCC
eukprot:189051_1